MNKFIGNKAFYKMVLAIAVPIMIQNGITNFVALLDNIMVGQMGTEQMSGVAIVNQLLFVFNLCIFGGLSGPGIFSAQFFGQKNFDGIRQTFRFKLIVGVVFLALGCFIFTMFGSDLISSYLNGAEDVGDKTLTQGYGESYLAIMLIGLFPFSITQVYSSTLRETNQTLVPMFAGLTAVLVNLGLNWVLIFGNLGAPALGASGAAIATVISRFIECAIVLLWTHINHAKNKFIEGAYRGFKITLPLAKRIIAGGLPLAVNEGLWSAGMAILNRCYSARGISVVAATNISSTIFNLFGVVFIALGTSVGIIVGQLLGAGKMVEAKETDTRLITFTVISGLVMGGIMVLFAPLFPDLYNTEGEVRALATELIMVSGALMPLNAFMHSAYFTIRSGGRTFVTFLFDSVYVWVITIPVALLLVNFTDFDILLIYTICQLVDIIKATIGFILIKKGVWLRTIVKSEEKEAAA